LIVLDKEGSPITVTPCRELAGITAKTAGVYTIHSVSDYAYGKAYDLGDGSYLLIPTRSKVVLRCKEFLSCPLVQSRSDIRIADEQTVWTLYDKTLIMSANSPIQDADMAIYNLLGRQGFFKS
jgi:hypothetical protein